MIDISWFANRTIHFLAIKDIYQFKDHKIPLEHGIRRHPYVKSIN